MTSTVAQFMAILSGGVNPSMLRQNLAANPTGALNFAGLLNASGQLTAEGQALLNTQNVQGQIGANQNGLTIHQLQTLATIDGAQGDAGAQILQFIRQQASVDGENTIVLNLSEKGLSQDIIDELQALFSASDLITILRDPNLNAQLDSELAGLTSDSVETNQMADIISGLLSQTQKPTDTIISFSADELNVAEDTLKKLLEDMNLDQSVEVSMQPVQMIESNQPLSLALLQQQMAGGADDRALVSMIGAKNPFALKDGSVNMTTEMRALIEQAMQRPGARAGAATIGQAVPGGAESIADRLAAITGGATGTGATDDFAGLMLSSDGEALINAEGDYVMPFEAGFRTAAQAANPLTAATQAAQAHPTSQMVAANLAKMATKTGQGEDVQSYRLQLDPPEMGRLDIEMDFIENTGQLKAVISAEKPETLGLLQRDMHVLLKAMQDAGFEGMNQNDLSFNLSGGQDQTTSGQNESGGDMRNASGTVDDGEMVVIDTQMSVVIDPDTGQKHVNMVI